MLKRQASVADGRGFLRASRALKAAASCAHAVRCGAQVEQSTRSTNRSFKKMVSQGIDPAEIYKAICSQRVELVFTAHPTQARRLPSSPSRLQGAPVHFAVASQCIVTPHVGLLLRHCLSETP